MLARAPTRLALVPENQTLYLPISVIIPDPSQVHGRLYSEVLARFVPELPRNMAFS